MNPAQGVRPGAGRHFPQLDSLRAIAIGFVMVEHYARGIAHFVPSGAGSLGVNLFFVLSGYLIMGGLLRDQGRTSRISAILIPFYIKRFFRLFPLYYAVLALLVILEVERVQQGVLWHAFYLSNVHPSFGGPSTIFWSLAVEEQFYLCLPLILFIGRPETLARRLWTAFCLCLFYKGLVLSFFGHLNWRLLQAAAEPLILGCLLALRLSGSAEGRLGKQDERALRAVALAAALGAFLIWWFDIQWLRHMFNQGLNGLFFCYLVYAALQGIRGPIGWLLDLPLLQYAGKISYGIYLVHSFVPDLLREALPTLPNAAIGLITLPAVILICAASYRCYERPLLQLGHDLAGRTFRRLAPMASPGPRDALIREN
jgi:peptidoglycan/LPS O-acetylase OafA/YrhL